jgi:hypothetical protein
MGALSREPFCRLDFWRNQRLAASFSTGDGVVEIWSRGVRLVLCKLREERGGPGGGSGLGTTADGWGKRTAVLRELAEAEDVGVGADIEVRAGQGWGGGDAFAKGVGAEEFEGATGADDVSHAIVVAEVDTAGGGDGRGVGGAADAAAIDFLAGEGIEAGEDAVVHPGIEKALVVEEGGFLGTGPAADPNGLRGTAAGGEADRVDGGLAPELEEDEAIAEDGAVHDFAVEGAFALAEGPELFAGLGIEGGEAVLGGDEDIGLTVVGDEEGCSVGGADGAIELPADFAGEFVEAEEEAGAFVMVPGEEDGVGEDDGARAVAPGHAGIAEVLEVAGDPEELAVVGVAGDVGVAEGDKEGVRGDGWGIDGEVGFLVDALIGAEGEGVAPEFAAGVAVEAEGEEGAFAVLEGFGGDEELVAVEDGGTGAPAR